jgi:integrase
VPRIPEQFCDLVHKLEIYQLKYWRPAVERAAPLPEGLTPHSLRRTFASVLVALGEDPAYVMGHADPKLTLSVYAREMRRKDGERERLRALVGGTEPTVAAGAMRHEEALEVDVTAG